MELTPEQQQAYYDSLPNQPAQRRRKRSQRGQRLSRALVHVDKETKDILTELSVNSGTPQIQLVSLAIRLLANAGNELIEKQLAGASDEPQRGDVDERSES